MASSSAEPLVAAPSASADITSKVIPLEIVRRLVFDGEQALTRVIKAPTGATNVVEELEALRGYVLLETRGALAQQISAERTLQALLEELDMQGKGHLVDEMELVFCTPDPSKPGREEEARA